MPLLSPREPDAYFRAAELFRSLRRRGITIRSTTDCLLVCIAEENGCSVLARDRDIARILGSGLVRVAAAPLPS